MAAPKISEEYLGTNEDPTITVYNRSDRLLTLRIGEKHFGIESTATLPLFYPAGVWSFYAAVPGAIPCIGKKEWKRGYR